MKKSKILEIIVYILLLIIGSVIALKVNYQLGLIIILFGGYGIIRIIYKIEIKKQGIKKGWANRFVFSLILLLIVDYIFFPKKFDFAGLIFMIPFIIIIWIFFRFYEKHYTEIQAKKEKKISFVEKFFVYLFIILLWAIASSSLIISIWFFRGENIPNIFIIIDLVLVLVFIFAFCLRMFFIKKVSNSV